MQNKYLVLAAVIALALVAAGCAKQIAQPTDVQDEASEPSTGDVAGGIAAIDVLDEEVQVEEMDINPDELSGLDF